jgi:IclR family acetate operon transcriptional repressor
MLVRKSRTSAAIVNSLEGVKSARRVLDILSYYGKRRAPAGLAAISRDLNLPKSSCLALIDTLQRTGFLYLVNADEGYYPTRRWLELAQLIALHDPLLSRVRPFMEDLCSQVGETVILGRRDASRVVYMDVVESRETLRCTAVPGQIKPLHGTASGKALLSTLSPEELRLTIKSIDLVAITPRTITDAEQLENEVLAGCRRGWHVSRGENDPAVIAIAAPVKLGGEQFVLVAAGPLQRVEGRESSVGQRLMKTCRKLEASLA